MITKVQRLLEPEFLPLSIGANDDIFTPFPELIGCSVLSFAWKIIISMTSIIDAFKSNSSLSFTFSSSKSVGSSYKAEYALNKEGYCFESDVSNAYWCISFSQPVTIGSYIISGESSWINWPTSWEISYSLDGSLFISKQIDKIDDLRGSTKKFTKNPPIYCKHFKISCKTNTYGDSHLFFIVLIALPQGKKKIRFAKIM